MTSPADFVHLHVHSDYSLIDGAAKTEALAKAAKKNGQVAVALTDHGSVSGTIDFWKACAKEGVKPLIGCEAYLAPGLDDLAHTRRGIDKYGNRIEDEKGKKKSFDYAHFTLIAKNLQGWHNLQKLSSIASLEGFYYRPRMSWALLTKYHEGLIALSGCLSGQLSNSLKIGKPELAEADARRWKELFGSDYYVELQPVVDLPGDLHQRLAVDQAKANDGCLAIARKLGIKTVATADVHYVDPAESAVQEVKICVNSYKTLDENRKSGLNMPPVFYFKSSEEMQALFRHYPEAVLATREIADKVEKVKVLPGKYFLPKFLTPDGSSSVDYFRRLCWDGLIRRYGAAGSFGVAQRLQYEMDCIEKMGFVDYFLVTHDFTTWARRHGVPVGPGRGSAAGSVVSYCLGITNIDPLRYDLIFERFLNPERVSMPDIDIDFCLAGDTEVVDAKTGDVATLGDLYRMGRRPDVFAVGDDLKLRRRASGGIVRKGRKNVFRVTTTGGRSVVATADHRFMSDGGWTRLRDLRPGNMIATARSLPVAGVSSIERHQLVLLAGIITEGGTTAPPTITLTQKTNDAAGVALMDEYERAAAAFSDTFTKRYVDSNGVTKLTINSGADWRNIKSSRKPRLGGHVSIPVGSTLKAAERLLVLATLEACNGDKGAASKILGTSRTGIYSRIGCDDYGAVRMHPVRCGAFVWAESAGLIGVKSSEKRLPSAVYGLADSQIAFLVGRLWSGDGCLRHGGSPMPNYTTTSGVLAEQIRTLLLRLGIVASVYLGRPYRTKSGEQRRRFGVNVVGDESLLRFCDSVLPNIVTSQDKDELLGYANDRSRILRSYGPAASDPVPSTLRLLVESALRDKGWTRQRLADEAKIGVSRFGASNRHGSRTLYARSVAAAIGAALGSDDIKRLGNSDVYWDRIEAIEPAGREETYDIVDVESDGNFSLANGLIAHNCERGRGRVIEYVKQKYGEKCVAQIITFGESKAKSAIRDVGRVLDMAIPEVNKIAKMIPEDPKAELKGCLETIPELKVLSETNAEKKKLFELAIGLEGLYRSEGKHAAGVVIGDMDLMERIPLKKVGKGDEAGVCTAFSMEQVEEVGLLKMDFLGLRTITQIYDTVALVKETTGKEIDPDAIPVRDNHGGLGATQGDVRCPVHEVTFSVCRCCDKALEVFRHAETNGVFQVEGAGMRKLLKQMKPDRFDDIVAIMALFRPGPLGSGMDQTYVRRKNGEEPIEYDHPKLEPILKKTMGLFIYQEGLMQMSVALAGFTLPQADELRKATAKKKPEAMAKIKDKFIPGCVKHSGLTLEHATEIWDKIVFFSEYSFNCIAGDSEVVCADTGRVLTMADLANSGERIRVHALDDNFSLRKRRVAKVWRTGKREAFELKTRSGRKVVATADHRFRTLEGWKELSELKPGDFVAVARELHAPGKLSMPHHEIVALAGFLSEGNTCHPSTLYFTNKDCPEFVSEMAECLAKFDDTVVRLDGQPGKALNVVANMGPSARQRHGERSGVFLWAEKLGIIGSTATQKRIPDVVFGLREQDLLKFVGRLWTGDGYVGWTDKPGRHAPFYATSSRVLAKQVQLLLGRLGILAVMDEKKFKYRYKRKGMRARPKGAETGDLESGRDAKGKYVMRPGFTVRLLGRLSMETFRDRVLPEILGYEAQKKRFLHLIETFDDAVTGDKVPVGVVALVRAAKDASGLTWPQITEKSGVSEREFMSTSKSKLGFGRGVVLAMAKATGSKPAESAASTEVFWDRIKSITPVGSCDMYDMEVDGSEHNFPVNNGVIVHNCSHSAAYGLISWRTAWLKANYPVEFFAALLTSWSKDTDKLALYVEEIRRLGVPLEPPDVNESDAHFRVKVGKTGEKTIIYGLDALKGVGSEAVRSITEGRKRVGSFASIFHFCETVELRSVTSAVLTTLAKANAFRSMGVTRDQLLTSTKRDDDGRLVVKEEPAVDEEDEDAKDPGLFGYDEPVKNGKKKGKKAAPKKASAETMIEAVMRIAKSSRKDLASGQTTFFKTSESSVADQLPQVKPWTLHQRLDAEREALGLYLTGHPLEDHIDVLRERVTIMSARVADAQGDDTKNVLMGGVVRAVKKHITTKGEEMAFVTLEDMSGKVDAVAFAATWEREKERLKVGRVLFLSGDLDMKRETPTLKIESVSTIEDADKLANPETVLVNFWDKKAKPEDKARVEAVLAEHPGKQRAFYRWWFGGMTFSDRESFAASVRVTKDLKVALNAAIVGRGSVQYVRE